MCGLKCILSKSPPWSKTFMIWCTIIEVLTNLIEIINQFSRAQITHGLWDVWDFHWICKSQSAFCKTKKFWSWHNPVSTQSQPPTARQRNAIIMAFLWRVECGLPSVLTGKQLCVFGVGWSPSCDSKLCSFYF